MARKRKEAAPHLRIRIEPELLTRLEKSRTANNRTLTGEIVHRIEQTYRRSDDADLATLVYRAAFGERTGDLLRAFATAIWLIERRTGKKWHEDPGTRFQVAWAIQEITEWFMRRRLDPWRAVAELKYPDLNPLEAGEPQKTTSVADAAVLQTLQVMGMAPPDAKIDEVAAKIRSDPRRFEEQERIAKWRASWEQEFAKRQADWEQEEKTSLAERRNIVAKADPKAKDESEEQ